MTISTMRQQQSVAPTTVFVFFFVFVLLLLLIQTGTSHDNTQNNNNKKHKLALAAAAPKAASQKDGLSLLKAILHDGNSAAQVIDLSTSWGPWEIRNDLFHGQLCIFLRGGGEYDFDGQDNVYWEVQLQGQFQRSLQGPLYLATELPLTQRLKVSWPMNFIIQALLAFCRHWGYDSIHMSLGEQGQVPHLAAPAFQSLDRVVVTPLSSSSSSSSLSPPPLGRAIPEPGVQARHRRGGAWKELRVTPNHIYTMSFNHTYFNPLDWKVYGIPLVQHIDVNAFTDSLQLTLYEVVVVMNEEEEEEEEETEIPIVAPGPHVHQNVIMSLQLLRQAN